MAPFARGKKGGPSSFKNQKNANGFSSTKAPQRNIFNSTRVESPTREISDVEDRDPEESESNVEEASSDVSSGEEEEVKPAVKPYNSLLQALNAGTQRDQPPRKKRKVEILTVLNDAKEEIGNAISSTNKQSDRDIDIVEELEEGGNLVSEDVQDVDELDDEENDVSAYQMHFEAPSEDSLSESISHAIANQWTVHKASYENGYKALLSIPQDSGILSRKKLTVVRNLQELQLKHKLEDSAKRLLPDLGSFDGLLASSIYAYQDLLFVDRSHQNADDLRALVSLHAINHVLKTRDRVLRNNARLAKQSAEDDLQLRDQGFTRPKVLILLPTRQSCVRYAETIIKIVEPEQQENKKRFQDSYTQSDDYFSEDKPVDFRELFAGNDDDMFRLGMKFTRKTVKFFAQFYNSDIIYASPLGLRMAIGAEGAKKQDHDFLSSIEVVLVDQADALLMQNWEHVQYIFEHLNRQPKETHGCDFSRVRNWYLDGNAKHLRQTIILSAFNTPELNGLFNSQMRNVAGKVKLSSDFYDGAFLDLGLEIKQTFSRYESPNPLTDPDSRFKYFTSAIVPSLVKSTRNACTGGQGVLVFVPSYMDFIRVRNYLVTSSSTQNVSFGSISEYTPVKEVMRARSHFFSGRHSILLYTGRAHHFRRYRLRGVRRIVMYSLPENPVFYKEIVGGYLSASVAEGTLNPGEATVRIAFSKWDALKTERIVGTQRLALMLGEKGGDTFEFT